MTVLPLKKLITNQSLRSVSNTPHPSIIIHQQNHIHILIPHDILYIQAQGNYCIIHLEDESILATKPLKYFKEKINDNLFIKCHQSYLVNLDKIKRINKHPKFTAQLRTGQILPISRSHKKIFLETLLAE